MYIYIFPIAARAPHHQAPAPAERAVGRPKYNKFLKDHNLHKFIQRLK